MNNAIDFDNLIQLSLSTKNKAMMEEICKELAEKLKKEDKTLKQYCSENNIAYNTFRKRFDRYGITLRKNNSSKKLNLGVCLLEQDVIRFKELAADKKTTAGKMLVDYVHKCIEKGEII